MICIYCVGENQVRAKQLALIAVAAVACNCSFAADITVVSTIGIRGFLEQVQRDFRRSTGDRLHIKYGFSVALKRQLDAGEPFDVVILPRAMIGDLASRGKIVGTTSAIVARSGMGLLVKAGTTKPFIGTRAALRTALLASSTIAYTTQGHSGVAAPRLFDVLGIARQLKGRIYLDTRPAGGLLAVAEGKATIGIALTEEIAADPRVELVGPLPLDLQSYVVFAAATAAGTKEPDACRAFIAFLRTPDASRILRKVGMESAQADSSQ